MDLHPELVGKTQHEDWWKAQGFRFAYDAGGTNIRPSAFTRDDSDIDREAAPVAHLKKEADMQADHTELLRQIAANTAVLPEMKKDLAAIRKILADYDAGRITREERDRRISRWVN